MHIWLQRMREQGWDVSDLVRRALACGATLKPEVCTGRITLHAVHFAGIR